MFLHARKGHVELLGKGCDRSVRTPELLQNAASGGVRERAERGIEVGLAILSHTLQYTTWVTAIGVEHNGSGSLGFLHWSDSNESGLPHRKMLALFRVIDPSHIDHS